MRHCRTFKVEGKFEELNNYSSAEIIRMLAFANGNDYYRGSDAHEALLDVVMNLGVVRNRLENYMPHKMYGYYGKTAIEFIYAEEYLSLDAYINEMKMTIREYLKSLSLEEVAYLEGNVNPFITTWLKYRLREANTEITLKYARTRYPDLTGYLLKQYVSLRKGSGYKADLDMPNAEIIQTFKETCPDRHISWQTLNRLKAIFGYPEEEDPAEIYRKEKKVFVQAHRNEMRFWQQTGACFISDAEYFDYCIFLQEDLSLTNDELIGLYDWCLKCKYLGLSQTDEKNIRKIRSTALQKYGMTYPINRVFLAGLSKKETKGETIGSFCKSNGKFQTDKVYVTAKCNQRLYAQTA